jgi:catechol 1,2-dioxygenase
VRTTEVRGPPIDSATFSNFCRAFGPVNVSDGEATVPAASRPQPPTEVAVQPVKAAPTGRRTPGRHAAVTDGDRHLDGLEDVCDIHHEGATMSVQRTQHVVGRIFSAVNEILLEEDVSYSEYQAATGWLTRVGEQKEWPLFLDVFFERSIEKVAAKANRGSQSTIEGPYYIPGAPELQHPYTMPMRDDEKGDPLIFHGSVVDQEGQPLPDVVLDMWQADADGEYSFINPVLPDYLFRGKVRTDVYGKFTLRTIVPAPYEIPKGGPTGELLAAARWHAWRPAHLHWMVSKDGYQPLTTQLYFAGGQWTDSDVADAVKPELLLSLEKQDSTDPTFETSYQFALGRA